MRRSTKILLAGGAGLATILLALFLIPLLFSERIEARVRAEIEEASGLRVSWTDARLGLLGDFPHPSLRLSGLQVLGTGAFEADTLARMEEAAISLNGPSLISTIRGGGPLVVRTVRLEAPRVRLRVTEDGVASWTSAAPSAGVAADESGDEGSRRAAGSEESAESGMAIALQGLRITDGDFELDDARTRSHVALRGLTHDLSGDFSRASLEAETTTRAEGLTLTLAGTPYLAGVGLDFQGAVRVDMEESRVELSDQELSLNELALAFGGSLARDEEGVTVDLAFQAPGTEFGALLSLASTLYANDFSELETSGSFALEGSVRGRYGPDDFPAFSLALSVADGRFRYPDLPLPAQDIVAELAVTNPGGALDSTVVDLSRFHVRIGSETFDASARIATPVSDPAVDLTVDGTLDLGSVARTVKLPQAEGLSGVIVADATVRARRSDVDSARYDRVDARGMVSATDVALRGEAFRHPVDVRALELTLSPQAAELTNLDAQAGSSDIRASGRLDNLLGFALGGGTLAGSGQFQSRRVVLDEWRSGRALDAIPVPPRLDLTLDGAIGELVLNGLELSDARGRAVVRDQRLTFDGFRLQGFGGRIAVDGYYETVDAERPTFAVTLDLDSLDIRRTSSALLSVRTLAPIAEYARGTFSTDLALSGALGQNLSPDLTVLDGNGSFSTSRVAVEGFPLLQRLGERLELPRISNPTLDAVRSSISIEGGRLIVDPYRVAVGGLAMSVSGSNGIDQSIDYGLTLEIPRSGLAAGVMDALAARAGPLASRLATVDPVPVRVRATGFVRDPSLDIGIADLTQSARTAVTDAAGAAAQRQIDDARARADSAEADARRRAQARADSVVAAAERQAETIRAEAARAAAEVRTQGNRAADELLARASNPLERAAAQRAADRLRSEADERATRIETEADARATQLLEEARERAAAILAGGGSG